MSGHFSVKSDVFSFGVLVLEIISGKKNWGFFHPDHDLNLLGHVSVKKIFQKYNLLEARNQKLSEIDSGLEAMERREAIGANG